MANTSFISSSFIIKVVQESAGAEAINIANSGRTFEVHEVYVQWKDMAANPSDSTLQVAKIEADGTVSNLFAAALTGNRLAVPVHKPNVGTSTNASYRPDTPSAFTAGDNIRVTTTNAATKVEVYLYCIGNPSQALVVT
jgi:hypothetical protein